MMTSTQSFMKKIMLFAFMILFVIGLLSLLNWVPLIMQKQKLKTFSSPDAATKELRIRKIYLPSYLPEHLNLAWPPAEVYGQDTPFAAVAMYLSFKQKQEIGLSLHQTDANAPYQLEPRLRIQTETTVRQIMIRGRQATLLVAVCENNIPCSQLSWDEHGTLITVTGKFSAQEIIKIATSMIPDA